MNIQTAILNQVAANIAQGEGEATYLFLGHETDKEMSAFVSAMLIQGNPIDTLEGATCWGMQVHVLQNISRCAFVGRCCAAAVS